MWAITPFHYARSTANTNRVHHPHDRHTCKCKPAAAVQGAERRYVHKLDRRTEPCTALAIGQSLVDLAASCGDFLPSELLYANPHLKSPRDIKAGVELKLPKHRIKRLIKRRRLDEEWCDPSAVYKIPAGESCVEVAQKFGVALDSVIQLNPGLKDACENGTTSGRKICLHQVQSMEHKCGCWCANTRNTHTTPPSMAQFMLNPNPQLEVSFAAYQEQLQDPTLRFRFWADLKVCHVFGSLTHHAIVILDRIPS